MELKKKLRDVMTMNCKANKGFTLVELIVVIAILAILAGVAIPAYSGYVKKAERAGDEQLLATVNRAYAAACIENGTDMDTEAKNGGSIPLVGEVGAKKIDFDNVKPFNESFEHFYAGNENTVFKVFESIVYSPSLKAFCDSATAPDMAVNGYWADRASVEAFKNSGLADIGVEKLVEIIDGASGMLNSGEVGSDDFENAVENEDFKDAAAKALGLADGAAYDAYIEAQKADAIAKYIEEHKNDGLNEFILNKQANEAAVAHIRNIQTNLMPVVGAVKAEEASEDLLSILTSSEAKSTIVNNVNGADTTKGLSQTALAYALYTSYANSNGVSSDMGSFILALEGRDENSAFKAYLADANNKAQIDADLKGALAVMDVVSKQDAEAVQNTVVNGIGDSGLDEALKQILG